MTEVYEFVLARCQSISFVTIASLNLYSLRRGDVACTIWKWVQLKKYHKRILPQRVGGDTDNEDTDSVDTDNGDTDNEDTDTGDTDDGDADNEDTDTGDTDNRDTDNEEMKTQTMKTQTMKTQTLGTQIAETQTFFPIYDVLYVTLNLSTARAVKLHLASWRSAMGLLSLLSCIASDIKKRYASHV